MHSRPEQKEKIVQMTRNLYQQTVPPDAVKEPGASLPIPVHHYHHHHQFLNREGRLGTTDDFATIFFFFSPFFPVLHCPLGLAELQACSFSDVVFPPLPLSALSSSPFHCALQDGFGKTWWTGNMTIPLQFASIYDRQAVFVWSIACWILAGTSSLVTWSLYEMRSILR